MKKNSEPTIGKLYYLDRETEAEFVGFVEVSVTCDSGIGEFDLLEEKPAFRVPDQRLLEIRDMTQDFVEVTEKSRAARLRYRQISEIGNRTPGLRRAAEAVERACLADLNFCQEPIFSEYVVNCLHDLGYRVTYQIDRGHTISWS